MFEERTNLYRVVAQNLLWIHGLTSMQYDIKSIRIAKIKHDGETHYSFDVVTNTIRLGRIKHPFGLVAEQIHITMSGVIDECPILTEFNFGEENNIAEVSIAEMYQMFLKADNSGLSNVSVQTKFKTFDGGDESIARHFMFKNNMLFQIR
jgi:hypothetical protein